MARNFYKAGNEYYYSDTNQRVPDVASLQAASKSGGKLVTPTQSQLDKTYSDAAGAHPAISALTSGGTPLAQIINGLTTGDMTGITAANGQPFSTADQQAALAKGMAANSAFYTAQQANDKNTAQNSLAKNQADYQDYLTQSGQNFQDDKAKADQAAADNGVLFSGGRVQKQQNLARA